MSRTTLAPRRALPRLLTTVVMTVGLLAFSAVGHAAPAGEPALAKPSTDAKKSNFRVATLNLANELSPAALAHDVRTMIATRRPTVIGFQERRDTKPALRAALPDHWALRMPTTADGTDDNPIAFDKRVWKEKYSFPRLLAENTWRRSSGQEAIKQYGVVTVLEHRRTGHTIRAISFHMPSAIHDRSTGGPNWAVRDRVGAFWRMADNVREVAGATPKKQQFIALCDCNVTESKDYTSQLVKGEITRPLGLENNYSAAGYRRGWRIDYVMSEKRSPFRIANWQAMHNLRTDHPGVVTKFRKR
jgi:hypothetical protein